MQVVKKTVPTAGWNIAQSFPKGIKGSFMMQNYQTSRSLIRFRSHIHLRRGGRSEESDSGTHR